MLGALSRLPYDRAVPALARSTPPAAGILPGVLLAMLAAACGESPMADLPPGVLPPSRTKMLLVGVDGLDDDIVDRLIERHELPHFEALFAGGTHGTLETLEPTASPALWTSIATGRRPEVHGIHHFLDEATQSLYGSSQVRVPWIWEVLGDRGRTVGIVNWWATWPPPEVNGFLVSNVWPHSENQVAELARFSRHLPGGVSDETARLTSTYPLGLVRDLQRFVVREEDIPPEDLQALGLQKAGFRYFWDYPEYVARREAGLWLYERERPDFMAVYFWFLDHVQHQYFNVKDSVVIRCYEEIDRMLGAFVARADEDTVVLVCSDHGFRRAALGTSAHSDRAFLAMRGPNVIPGGSIEGASILDLAPTILALLGGPIAEDLPGRILAGALRPEFLERFPPPSVATFGPAQRPAASRSLPLEEELQERLRSLGYIK